MHTCICMLCACMYTGVCRHKKRAPDVAERELQAVVSRWMRELEAEARAAMLLTAEPCLYHSNHSS